MSGDWPMLIDLTESAALVKVGGGFALGREVVDTRPHVSSFAILSCVTLICDVGGALMNSVVHLVLRGELSMTLEGVGVDHGEHLGEALAHFGDAFGRISEGKPAPGQVVRLMPVKV